MGFLVHQGATVICAHGGQAQPSTTVPRVTLSGQPAEPSDIEILVSRYAGSTEQPAGRHSTARGRHRDR